MTEEVLIQREYSGVFERGGRPPSHVHASESEEGGRTKRGKTWYVQQPQDPTLGEREERERGAL